MRASKLAQHTRNVDLVAKYKNNGALTRRTSTANKLLRFLLQLLVLAIWKSVRALCVPFGKLFAFNFWIGKSIVTLTLYLEKQLLNWVGWLSGTGFSREDSKLGRWSHHHFGGDVKRWHFGLGALMLGGIVHGVVKVLRNQFDEKLKLKQLYIQLMRVSNSYEEWKANAMRLEELEGPDKVSPAHEDYDRRLIAEKLRHLKCMRATRAPREMMLALRIDLIRNVANIAKSQKHRHNFVSVPEPIQAYIKEVTEELVEICDWPEHELPFDEKVSFFKATRHTFGRTALLLSGGGGLGTFHLGVCKALFERNMLPTVLAGSSVGSIVCAVVGTRTNEELKRTFANLDNVDIGFFRNSTAVDLMRSAMSKGHLQDVETMIKKLRRLCGDDTFLEAYKKTGRILNVTVCAADTNEPPRLLNYLTAPQAMVWSAVAASSSFPGLYPPQHLLGKNSKGQRIKVHGHGGGDAFLRRWRDGSLEFDLPVQSLAELFNCNHFIVSQTNPHIVPLVNFKSLFPHKWANIIEAELKHRLQVMQWMLPEFKITKWLTLFTQPWEGDITFTLPGALYNLRKTIVNPSTVDLMRATHIGQHSTWERMSAIECNCRIEATLDLCAAKLGRRHKEMGRAMSTMGGTLHAKLPSFVHVPSPANGMFWGDGITDAEVDQGVASWGDFSALNANAVRGAYDGDMEHDQNEVPPLGVRQDVHRMSLNNPPMPPIASSCDADEHDHDDHDDSFDSDSSPAPALSATASMRRGDPTAASSTGISRRSSVMRGLNLLSGHHDADELPFATHTKPSPGSSSATSNNALPTSHRSSLSIHADGAAPSNVQASAPTLAIEHGPVRHTSGIPRPTSLPEQPNKPQDIPPPIIAAGPGLLAAQSRLGLRSAGSIGPGAEGPVNAPVNTQLPANRTPPAMKPHRSPTRKPEPMNKGGFFEAEIPRPASAPTLATGPTITEERLLALAAMDTGGMIDDIWGTFLPLAGTCENLVRPKPQPTSTNGTVPQNVVPGDGDAIDIFAY